MKSVRQRVSILEDRVDQESGLRAELDRNQSGMRVDIDGIKRLIQAVAETQSDHGRMIRALRFD